MSQPKLSQVDIKKLFVKYMRTTYNIDIDERRINVVLGSPEFELERFDKNSDNEQEFTSKVTFVNEKDTALAQVFTKVLERKNFCRISLKPLVIKGLLDETTIRLPLDDNELRREFGKNIEIDASKALAEKKKSKRQDRTASVYENIVEHGRDTTALFTCRKKEAQYLFRYIIVMDSLLTIPVGSRVYQCTVAEVINAMKNEEQYACLCNVEVDGDKFELRLSGTVEFRWDCHENVTWV
ncbi:hypothetical protein BsWGS_10980 [Bradybaena similaris]